MVRRFASLVALLSVAACGGNVATPNQQITVINDAATDSTGDSTPADSGAADATVADTAPDDTGSAADAAPAQDTGYTSQHEGGITCGSATCTGTDVCCASGSLEAGVTLSCASSCGDAGSTIACTSPDNCGQNPCCTQISAATTTPGALCTTAPSDCVPAISFATQSAQTRLCRDSADCTSGVGPAGTQLAACCTITYQGSTFKGCFNKQFAPAAGQVGATIVCP